MKVIRENIPFGVYVVKNHEGKYVIDEEWNYLSVQAMRGDLKKIGELCAAARACGIDQPEVEFWEGHRKIDDEEYERQLARQRDGYVPDEYDIGSQLDDYRDGRI